MGPTYDAAMRHDFVSLKIFVSITECPHARQSASIWLCRRSASGSPNWRLQSARRCCTDVYAIVGNMDNNQVDGLYPLPSFMAARGTRVGFSAGLRHRF